MNHDPPELTIQDLIMCHYYSYSVHSQLRKNGTGLAVEGIASKLYFTPCFSTARTGDSDRYNLLKIQARGEMTGQREVPAI